MTTPLKFLTFALVAAALTACGGPRKTLMADQLHLNRADKSIIIPTGVQNKVQVYDYVTRLCDIDANGVESNCKDSTILSNVVP
jgi:hypothetical protein